MDIYKENLGASERDIRESLNYAEIGRVASRLSEVFKEMSEIAIKREGGAELSPGENERWAELSKEAHTLVAQRGLFEGRLLE